MSNVIPPNQLSRDASNIPRAGGDLSALALLVQIERFSLLEDQVRDEFDDMQKRNDWLKTANSALAALRANRPDDKGIRSYGEFVDAHGETQNTHQWMLANGIAIEQKAGDTSGVQSDFDAAISNLKARIDTENSESQMALIRLQSLLDKVNRCVELATNLVAKDGKAKENIIANIR
ncbi:hypothetical protein BPNPMPFG_006764 (plasmid) [Mesorhizobium sp. AR07]|uniref:Uncharacterized protein n=1 Tax=Mesorhizobium huakuii TaxID=28104 RepID=A0A7G6T5V8_9HYPH|nr:MULTISPECIES: hypothetical protein [Mesorhizobium]QND62140.1 hypothetical protein HB778_39395 [Mesorhizobium huakuii]QND69505.1 hypothetical protein HB777_38330 [Mesorhizobium loti]UVK49078.1 hypothetical protein BPNPMPFG_006764 [Mesorhizobium sp. AR07]